MAKALSLLSGVKAKRIGIASHNIERENIEQSLFIIASSILHNLYYFNELKTEEKGTRLEPKDIDILTANLPSDKAKEVIQRAIEGEYGSAIARDLANLPPNILYPEELARRVKRIFRGTAVKCRILNQSTLKKDKWNTLLSVANGSHKPPVVIVLEYKGDKKKQPTAIIGKAITFDSGGINIKPSKSMEEMKFDMCGGAAVIGTIYAISKLEIPVNIVGIIPATENLPGGGASRPSDIVKSLSGLTVEILNTDAEGRLILCDAIAYAKKKFKPISIIDLATLTGAAIIALGHEATPVVGNNNSLVNNLIQSGEFTGERLWRLPDWDEYADLLKSDIADIKNVGNGTAGTITGAMFLKKFVEDTPWAHLDIAGTAYSSEGKLGTPKGPSGVGVQLLLNLFHYEENEG